MSAIRASILAILMLALQLPALAQQPPGKEKQDPAGADLYGDPLPAFVHARLGTIRFRHGGPVSSLRYLPDGKSLLSCGHDQTLCLWDADTGQESFRFKTQLEGSSNQYLMCINGGMRYLSDRATATWCLSPDGRILARIETEAIIRLQDLKTGKEIRQLKPDQAKLTYLQFSPDSQKLAAVAVDKNSQGMIILWDVASGKELRQLVGPVSKEEGQGRFLPSTLTFSPDSKTIASIGNEFGQQNMIRIWDVAGGKEPRRLVEHSCTKGPLVFSPNGKVLAEVSVHPISGGKPRLRLWDTATGKQLQELAEHSNNVIGLFFSPDGMMLLAVEDNCAVRLWEVGTGKELPQIAAENSGVAALVFSSDGRSLAVAQNKTIHLLEAATGKELHKLQGFDNSNRGQFQQNLFAANQGLGWSLAFSTDSKTLAAAGSDNLIRRWSVETGKEVPPVGGHEYIINAVAFAPDGRSVATAAADGVRIWDWTTAKELRRLVRPADKKDDDSMPTVLRLAFAPGGRLLAAGWSDATICVWEAATGKKVMQFKGTENGIQTLAFTPDGKALAAAGTDGRVLRWEVPSGKQLSQFAGPAPANSSDTDLGSIALSPDGKTMASARSGGYVRLWELSTGKLRRQFGTPPPPPAPVILDNQLMQAFQPLEFVFDMVGGVSCIGFSPDGTMLAWVEGSIIRLLDLTTGKELRQFGGQQGSVNAIDFNPSGKILAAASDDGTTRFWDVATGTVLGQVKGHRGPATSLNFSPDGQTLVSASRDTSALVWKVGQRLQKKPEAGALSSQDVADLWNKLGSEDASLAFDIQCKLKLDPQQAVPFLQERLQSTPPVDAARIDRLLTDLENESFEVRTRAGGELEKLGELAERKLRKCLAGKPSSEVRQSVERILEKVTGPVTSVDAVRALRAMEVLEMIGTADARKHLDKLAQGAPESRQTQEAKLALDRLTRRTKTTP